MSGVIASHELDIDKLLWIPGEKKIFLPSYPQHISMAQIVDIELQRVLPKIRTLFERDDYFYAVIRKQNKLIIEGSSESVPVQETVDKDVNIKGGKKRIH